MRPNQQFDELGRHFRLKSHKFLSKLNDIFLFFLEWYFNPDIFKSMLVIFFIFYQDFKIEFIFILLLSQPHGLFEVIQVFTNFNGCFNIK